MKRALVTCLQMQRFLDSHVEPEWEFVRPVVKGQAFSSEEMISLARGHRYVIAGDDNLDRAFFEESPDLELVVRWGVGLDNVDLAAAEAAGVTVVNTPGVFSEDVAQLALAYLLALCRRVLEVDRSVRAGEWPRIEGSSISGMQIGILGFGGIGQELSRYCLALGASVQFVDPHVDPDSTGVYKSPTFEKMVEQVDICVLTASLNESTFKIANSESLANCKRGMLLVNVSRGGLVDEKIIPGLLCSGKLGGFATDVFETEPLPDSSRLRDCNFTIFGSHNASNTWQGSGRASRKSLQILNDFYTKNSL